VADSGAHRAPSPHELAISRPSIASPRTVQHVPLLATATDMLNPFGPHRDEPARPRAPKDPEVVLRVEGDIDHDSSRALHDRLRAAARRRDIRTVVLDFTGAGRIDSSGIAVISLARRLLNRHGKQLELRSMTPQHEAAMSMIPKVRPVLEAVRETPGLVERVGDALYNVRDRGLQLLRLIRETVRQGTAVLFGGRRMPAGAFVHHSVTMGVDALFIVGLLSFLMGMTLAFQGAAQLSRFGAGVYVVDLIGLSMVREFAPLMTAIILSGRAGAAIAAELGTMRAGAEIDALQAMGISPVRFLVLPRLTALTVTLPALTLLAMLIGVGGGMLVAAFTLDMSPPIFAARIAQRVDLGDFLHGLGKSLIFAWIIGVTGTFFGMNTPGNASAVGAATTRTVVVCVFCILFVDATIATISTIAGTR
jgi:phospholipid/cholesterol/gamma-HCH transport system permease protein